METMEVLRELFNVATVEIIFCIVVFKLILTNYKPPIQQSIQAAVCVLIAVTLALIVNPTIESFMLGIISAGIGFYGGIYIDEIRGIKKDVTDDEDEKEIRG